MKVKIFSRPWSVELAGQLENEINAFLGEVSTDAVKQVNTSIIAARTQGGDVRSEAIVTIWYEPVSRPIRVELEAAE
jgi:hypothetical protein